MITLKFEFTKSFFVKTYIYVHCKQSTRFLTKLEWNRVKLERKIRIYVKQLIKTDAFLCVAVAISGQQRTSLS